MEILKARRTQSKAVDTVNLDSCTQQNYLSELKEKIKIFHDINKLNSIKPGLHRITEVILLTEGRKKKYSRNYRRKINEATIAKTQTSTNNVQREERESTATVKTLLSKTTLNISGLNSPKKDKC